MSLAEEKYGSDSNRKGNYGRRIPEKHISVDLAFPKIRQMCRGISEICLHLLNVDQEALLLGSWIIGFIVYHISNKKKCMSGVIDPAAAPGARPSGRDEGVGLRYLFTSDHYSK